MQGPNYGNNLAGMARIRHEFGVPGSIYRDSPELLKFKAKPFDLCMNSEPTDTTATATVYHNPVLAAYGSSPNSLKHGLGNLASPQRNVVAVSPLQRIYEQGQKRSRMTQSLLRKRTSVGAGSGSLESLPKLAFIPCDFPDPLKTERHLPEGNYTSLFTQKLKDMHCQQRARSLNKIANLVSRGTGSPLVSSDLSSQSSPPVRWKPDLRLYGYNNKEGLLRNMLQWRVRVNFQH